MSLRRNALLLIALAGLLAIMGEWSIPLARWWCLPAGALLLGLAYEAAVLGRIRLELRLVTAERWHLGRPQRLEFRFRQNDVQRLAIEVAIAVPEQVGAEPRVETLELSRGLETSTSLEVVGRRLGSVAWPQPDTRVGGALSLAWWSRRVAANCTVTVVPDLLIRSGPARGSRSSGEQRARTTGAGTEIFQLREYRRGDPLRLIDWKASARRGRPISRDMTEDQHLEIIVAVDAGRASGLAAGEVDRLSLYINVAARLAQRAVEMGDAVGLVVFAAQPMAELAPARGDAGVARIRRLLSACRLDAGESNPVLAAARIRTLTHRRSLVVLLTDLEDASTTEQLTQTVRLLHPKHFALIAGLESARIAALAETRVRDPLGAYRALAAVEYTNTLTGNVAALHALGAAAITARPQHLDRAVVDAYREHRRRHQI
ncbi:MAG TPA: DUF58 domain-containing protein [Steroidobacteraceae bacterium]|nr:DUF58 domain-containing protein [Steroidobacteraceae bacterium]